MSDDDLSTILCEQPVAEFDDFFCTSGHTTHDGRFLVAWPHFSDFLFLIDLYRGEKT